MMMAARPKPILEHMPDHLKEEIIKSCSMATRRMVRMMSKQWMRDTDAIPVTFEAVNLSITDSDVRCIVNQGHGINLFYKKWNTDKNEIFDICQQPIDMIAKNLVTRGHAVKTFNLDLSVNEGVFSKPINKSAFYLERLIGTLKQQMSTSRRTDGVAVEHLNVFLGPDAADMRNILSVFCPGYLKSIEFKNYPRRTDCLVLENMPDAWKQAKKVKLHGIVCLGSYQVFAHFETVVVNFYKMSLELVKEIVEAWFRNKQKYAVICCSFYNIEVDIAINGYLGQFDRTGENTWEFNVPGRELRSKVSYSGSTIHVTEIQPEMIIH